MDDGEFEFPPDQINGELQPAPTATLPLSALAQTPISQLPPTNVSRAERRSLRQLMRGSLCGHRPHTRLGSLNDGQSGSHEMRSQDNLRPSLFTTHVATSIHSADTFSLPRDGVTAPTVQEESIDNLRYINDRTPDLTPSWPHQYGSETIATSPSTMAPMPGGLFTEEQCGGNGDKTSAASTRTWTERWGPKRTVRTEWTGGEVREFYHALSQYGTDFGAIAVLFGGRSREDIKRLYHRELRRSPNDVRRALDNKIAIDLHTFNALLHERRRQELPPKKILAAEEEELLRQIAQTGDGKSEKSKCAEACTEPHASNTISDFDFTDVSPVRPEKCARSRPGSPNIATRKHARRSPRRSTSVEHHPLDTTPETRSGNKSGTVKTRHSKKTQRFTDDMTLAEVMSQKK